MKLTQGSTSEVLVQAAELVLVPSYGDGCGAKVLLKLVVDAEVADGVVEPVHLAHDSSGVLSFPLQPFRWVPHLRAVIRKNYILKLSVGAAYSEQIKKNVLFVGAPHLLNEVFGKFQGFGSSRSVYPSAILSMGTSRSVTIKLVHGGNINQSEIPRSYIYL